MSKIDKYNRQELDVGVEYEYFITSDIPIQHIIGALKNKGCSEKEIERITEKINLSRERIFKVVKKFHNKITLHYNHLDVPEIINKGMKYATSYGLTNEEKKLFITYVLKGDVNGNYSYDYETKFSDIGKFLGFNNQTQQLINIKSKDFGKLNNLLDLFKKTKYVHERVIRQAHFYRDCAPEAINGIFDRGKNIVSSHIHPVIIALFLPKIKCLENKMLFSNISRMVIMKGQAYVSRDTNIRSLIESVTTLEINCDYELAHSIAHDPNSSILLNDISPLVNLEQRFLCQYELYRVVLNLRQGRYYASTNDTENDSFTGIERALRSCNTGFFDSPELFNSNDEGTILRKLYSVFSIRPTYIQISNYGMRYGLGYSNITNISQTKFIHIPIVNIRLPIDLLNKNKSQSMLLGRALEQVDYFVEHKTIVPKNKSVIFSNKILTFYANRKYPTVNFNNISMGIQNYNVPISFSSMLNINKTNIVFSNKFRLGKDWFCLRSVVMLQRSPFEDVEMVPDCAAAVIMQPTSLGGLQGVFSQQYIYYNPSLAAIQYPVKKDNITHYTSNTPITFINSRSMSNDDIGFYDEAQTRGTIFFYVLL